MSSELLNLPGAVAATGADFGVAAHYGNPFVEQRDLAEGRAVVDLSNRAVLSVSGLDRLTWIDSITSQSVAKLAAGDSAETLFLDQNGRVEHAANLVDDGDTLWLLLEAASAAPLLAYLLRMRFMLRVEPADRTAEFATVGSMGPSDVSAAAPHGTPLIWRDPWAAVAAGGWQYAGSEHPASDWTWTETLVPRADLAELGRTHPFAGALAAEALRIAAWRPRAAAEVDDKTIPHELDWMRSAVHLNKGCYRGQETVAKVHNLGRPPRRMVMLHLDGSDGSLPEPGDAVSLGGTVIGRITSAARHFELGPIALAVIKRSAAADATLTVTLGEQDSDHGAPSDESAGARDRREIAAAQEIIVPVGAGVVAGVPRLPRLGAVTR